MLFSVGLQMFIVQAVDRKSFEWWESVLMTLPMAFWVYWVWAWVKRKKSPDLYTMYFQGLSSEELTRAREYVERNISRNRAEDSAGAERESGVSSTWSHDIPESRPKDGKV